MDSANQRADEWWLALLAIVLLTTPALADSKACQKLNWASGYKGPRATATMVGVKSGSIYWNGIKVREATFTDYLARRAQAVPRDIFIVQWDAADQGKAMRLLKRIKVFGFEIAIHCDPVPF